MNCDGSVKTSRAAQEAVVDEERAGVVRCVCKTVLMIGLQRAVKKADVICDQLQIATDRLGIAARRRKFRLIEKLSSVMASAPSSSQKRARRGVSTWA